MNICAAGHKVHDKMIINTSACGIDLLLSIYDTDKYMGFAGYCTGQDDISRTIEMTGIWEPIETKIVVSLLQRPMDKGYVLDFGAHIGWFSMIAAKMGYTVTAFEGDNENADQVEYNAALNGVSGKITVERQWIDENQKPLTIDTEIELLKIDLEGNDQYAVNMCAPLFNKRLIKNALIEVSPVFNGSYPAMVQKIVDHGYDVFCADDARNLKPFDFNYNFDQTNLLFVRQ